MTYSSSTAYTFVMVARLISMVARRRSVVFILSALLNWSGTETRLLFRMKFGTFNQEL